MAKALGCQWRCSACWSGRNSSLDFVQFLSCLLMFKTCEIGGC